MAQNREYGYFLKGNKIAIVEKDWRFGGGQTTSVPGLNDVGQTGSTYWKSPTADSTNGIEIEYTYSPKYWINDNLMVQSNQFYLNGWTVIDGYLVFIRSHLTTAANWGSSPYNVMSLNESILIRGSGRWNGLHKIQSVTSTGLVFTWTKVSTPLPGFQGSSNVDIDGESGGKAKISVNVDSDIWLASLFSEGDYIVIDNSAGAPNNGLWKISEMVTGDGTAADEEDEQYFYIKNKYFVLDTEIDGGNNQTDHTSEYEDTTTNTTAEANGSARITKAYRDHCYLISDINTLNDEDDNIPIQSYLSKALVCYVKARIAEDQMNIEAKEYYMRMFREKLEKHDTSKVWGKKATMPSRSAIR